ncbi:MAG: L,D-transpeptidase family protein [Roseitalea sp.]|jgi:L,D-peptidoglycan transpeptidase YkuD (ErfK/YbiS/YcfS/YnhG family)|nr:L,D-transpeptidase family protein [Roseitalea sp.]MBO6723638.1 L,D-transpeptidase family protein [Roseitalea sp.]MBO6744153.1 L,D-transpeptidase family protein [Roseitalea sp.]
MLKTIQVRRKPGETKRGVLIADGRALPCALGRAGPSALKREGDGATPAHAIMRPLWGYWRSDRGLRPPSILPLRLIGPDDGWCDAPDHPSYNAPIRLPFDASHEVMRRTDCLYDICIVLDWNMAPRGRARHRGSAIFLHMAKPGFPPTAGCIALGRRDLQWLVARIDRRTRIVVMR